MIYKGIYHTTFVRTGNFKGYMKLPDQIVSGYSSVMVARFIDCLFLSTPKSFREIEKKINEQLEIEFNKKTDSGFSCLMRFKLWFIGSACEYKINQAHYIKLTESVLRSYQIKSKVIIVGKDTHFQLWDAENYNSKHEKHRITKSYYKAPWKHSVFTK